MEQKIYISVVIPAFNASETITTCLDSVLEQTTPVYEIIVINDGSDDDTFSKLGKYREKNNLSNLLIINQSNGGPSKARNRGIDAAKGNWIAFLDSDDRWLPSKIEEQFKVIKNYPDCPIIGTALWPAKKEDDEIHLNKVTFRMMLLRNRLVTSTVLVKKTVVAQFGFDESIKHAEDYKLWLQILYLHWGIVISKGLAIYADNRKYFTRTNALSNNLFKMGKNSLLINLFLFEKKMINLPMLVFLTAFSLLKWLRLWTIFLFNRVGV